MAKIKENVNVTENNVNTEINESINVNVNTEVLSTLNNVLNTLYPTDIKSELPALPEVLTVNFNPFKPTPEQSKAYLDYMSKVNEINETAENTTKFNDSIQVLIKGIVNADDVPAFLLAWLKEYAPVKVISTPTNKAKRERSSSTDVTKNFAAMVTKCINDGKDVKETIDILVSTFTDKSIELVVSNLHWYATNANYCNCTLPDVAYTTVKSGELVTKTSNNLVTLHKFNAVLDNVYYTAK